MNNFNIQMLLLFLLLIPFIFFLIKNKTKELLITKRKVDSLEKMITKSVFSISNNNFYPTNVIFWYEFFKSRRNGIYLINYIDKVIKEKDKIKIINYAETNNVIEIIFSENKNKNKIKIKIKNSYILFEYIIEYKENEIIVKIYNFKNELFFYYNENYEINSIKLNNKKINKDDFYNKKSKNNDDKINFDKVFIQSFLIENVIELSNLFDDDNKSWFKRIESNYEGYKSDNSSSSDSSSSDSSSGSSSYSD